MMDLEGLQDFKSILRVVKDQHETIQLLQAEIGFQRDRLDKQEQTIEKLSAKVDGLSAELMLKKNAAAETDASPSSIWKDTESLSIADAVKETAEKALLTNLGFVFDANTKLYCNYSTGYYYDPGPELFYNGHTGIYYTYDADNQKYLFHSQVQLEKQAESTNKHKTDKNRRKHKNSKPKQPSTISNGSQMSQDHGIETKRRVETKGPKSKMKTKKLLDCDPHKVSESVTSCTVEVGEDMEEGELSGSDRDDRSDDESYNSENSNCNSSAEEEEYPPCIRAIILETNSDEIKKGSLFLVTCMGGTIGSEGPHHTIILPDPSVEKHHATIVYSDSITDRDSDDNIKVKKYLISDAGTASGTFLNGTRLSEPLENHEIVHGSIVKIGDFSILMHIHPGSFTCGHCEPGLIMESTQSSDAQSKTNQNEKPKTRNALMKQLKKKYGIGTTSAQRLDTDIYKDRSHERRKVKGSDNPYEKTHVVTAEETISKDNKGFKMLAKMGWSTGESLGHPTSSGLKEPIKLELKLDRAGLGMSGESCSTNVNAEVCSSSNNTRLPPYIPNHRSQEHLAITLKRFKEAGATEAKMEVDAETDS